jgi:indole-3-glycerol phosphate synthase
MQTITRQTVLGYKTMKDIPDILRKICRVKEREIAELQSLDTGRMEGRAASQEPARGLRRALTADGSVALIAEVKKASPSAGIIRPDFDPVQIARTYEANGARAISVLTDREFFQGSEQFLCDVRAAVELPLLRKDFILDEAQVLQARALGADGYLLIVACLSPQRLSDLMAYGRDLGMDPLVEVHDKAELEVALDAGADLLGINNRDLRTFDVDLATTDRLAPLVPEGVALVGESGIKTPEDVRRLGSAGVDAVLIGETLMRADDLDAAVGRFADITP